MYCDQNKVMLMKLNVILSININESEGLPQSESDSRPKLFSSNRCLLC